MTEDKMKGLFGGGEAAPDAQMTREMERQERKTERQEQKAARRAARRRSADEVARAQDFINRYSTGNPAEGFSSEEAATYLRELRQEATPEEWRHAATAAINNLPPDQRQAFNQMLEQRRAGTGMVTIDRTGDARAAEGRAAGQQGDPGLDDMLGGLFGGLLGGAAAMPEPRGGSTPSASAPDMNPLDDLFGGLFGGGDDKAPEPRQQEQQQQQPGGIDDILQNPLGKAVLGGIAAFALKELIDKQNQG
jgi:hypothetical protein